MPSISGKTKRRKEEEKIKKKRRKKCLDFPNSIFFFLSLMFFVNCFIKKKEKNNFLICFSLFMQSSSNLKFYCVRHLRLFSLNKTNLTWLLRMFGRCTRRMCIYDKVVDLPGGGTGIDRSTLSSLKLYRIKRPNRQNVNYTTGFNTKLVE